MLQEHEVTEADELRVVPLADITMNPYQPRREFSPEELRELSDSMKSVGILHPPLVRPLPTEGLYELVSGERRYRAAQLAGLRAIPVYIRHTAPKTAAWTAQAALIENIQRVNLNPMEIARALKRLLEELALSQDQLSQQLGMKRSTASNYLRLLALPKPIQESLEKEAITMGHAKAILALEGEKQLLLHELILRDQMNVRQAELAATRIAEKAQRGQVKYVARDFYLDHLASRLQEHLGTKTTIDSKGKGGRIYIDYYSTDDLNRLLDILGLASD